MKNTLILVTLVFVSFMASCQKKAETSWIKQKTLDIPYANASEAQKLDIYLPNEGKGPFPTIIQIHGGAFMLGDKSDKQLTPVLEAVKHGYAVVAVNYRMSGEAKFPALIHDLKAAIRFIRANAQKYNLKTDNLAVWGNSAGGYLSALAGTSGDVAELEDKSQGNPTFSSRVKVVVDWYGPINFLTMDNHLKVSGKGKPMHNELDSPESRLWGKPIQEIPNEVKISNPETYITPDDAVFFIQHGSEDELVPTQQSTEFAEKLQRILGNDKVIIDILEGANHGTKEFETPENIKKTIAFLDKYMK